MKWVEVVHTKSKGRCVVACRNIPAGTVILTEAPLACVPRTESTLSGVRIDNGPYKLSPIECSLQHNAATRGLRGFDSVILASRLLQSSKVHDIYSRLVYHPSNFSGTNYDNLMASAQILQRLLQHSSKTVSVEACATALQKLSANAFTMVDDDFTTCGIAIYGEASAINHSCLPTAMQRFTPSGDLQILVVRPLRAGQEVTIAYFDPTIPRARRQKQALSSYGFYCLCPRCAGSGEGLEAFDGFRCSRCGIGAMAADHHYGQLSYEQWLLGASSLEEPIEVNSEEEEMWHFAKQKLRSAGDVLRCEHCDASESISALQARCDKLRNLLSRLPRRWEETAALAQALLLPSSRSLEHCLERCAAAAMELPLHANTSRIFLQLFVCIARRQSLIHPLSVVAFLRAAECAASASGASTASVSKQFAQAFPSMQRAVNILYGPEHPLTVHLDRLHYHFLSTSSTH